LKEKELQEISKLLIGICEYIKNDALTIILFYKNTQTTMKNVKITSLLYMLYNLLLKTLSYLPSKFFSDTYSGYLDNNLDETIKNINKMYSTINTKENYESCNSNVDTLITTGNLLLYRYIINRMCIIDKDKYLNTLTNKKGGWPDFNKLKEKASEKYNLIKESTCNRINSIKDFNYAQKFKNLLWIDIRALEKTFNDSVDIIVENKRFIEQQVSKNANSKFLYAGEQLRQLVGDYAIMDTTYTMSVTRYVFDFNNYLIDNIQNIQNLQKAKSRLDDTGTIIESILTTDVTTINVELRDQMYKLQNNLATSVFTSLSGLVYNSIFEKFSEMIDEKVSEVKKQVSEIQTIQLSDDTTS
jgi:hypothetical protein